MTPSKSAFLSAYHTELRARYPWAKTDEIKLALFMESCHNTLNGGGSWHHEGEAVVAAWRSIGGKGKPTLKALRAMPF